jgi:ribonucleoside-diphosphate reductase alpha chain
MGVLRIDHPDILEFIQSKNDKKSFRNFNISVLVTDKFMTAYYDDETYDLINPHNGEVVKKLPARLVMDYIVFSAHSCGDPGMVFIDRINKKHSLRNLEIKGVNVCIGKDVLVPSKDGMTKISDVKGAVYNGKKKLYRIFTKDGYELDATEDHKILTDVGWKEVRDLSCDDNLTLSVLSYFGDRGTYEAGLISGWYLGDGWHTGKDDRATLAFYGKDKGDLVSFYHDAVKKELGQDLLCTESENRIDIRSRKILKLIDIWGLKDKKNLDMLFESTKDFQKGFLQGLFTADGYFKGKSTSKFVVSLAQSNLNTLKKVQLLLLNFGVKSHIYENRRLAGYREMPDGKGGMKSYWCEANHELDITGMDAEIFANDIGFLLRYKQEPLIHLLQTPARGPYKRSFTTGFMKIEELGEDDVYDLVNMPGHRFSANGIVVHNCGEQPLAPNESCLLGAINLSKFVKDEKVNYKELRRIVTLVVHFLDNLIDVNNYPLKQIDVATRKARKIGVGIMGWAEMLIQLGVPYDSKEALELAESVMGFIDNEAHKASRDLAVVRGNFPLFDDYKRNYRNMRNAVVTTAAPTGSRSILADTSSGIEPLFSVAQTRVTGDGMILSDFNKYFIKALEDRGLWNEELKLLVGKKGHVGDIDGIPDDIRELYKTSHEIPSLQHVLMQAAFQKHIGSSVSKTVNFNNGATLEDVRDVYLKAYETGCKGITVYRDGSLGKQVLYAGCETCDL